MPEGGLPTTHPALPPALSSPPTSQTTSTTTRISHLSHFASGLSSGALAAFILQPADLLKTRLQQSHPRTSLAQTFLTIARGPQPIQTLWRGTVPSVIRTSVGSALYFSTLASIRDLLATESQRHAASSREKGHHSSALVQVSPTANLLSGAIARASVGFVMMPITILKVRFESDLYPQYRSLWSASASILRTEGIAGFFRGWGATAVRDAPNAGLYLFFYEAGKKSLSRLVNDGSGISGSTAAWVNMFSSALAGAASTAVTNPFDTLKTRLQVEPGVYKNMWSAFVRIMRDEGGRRLFDGLGLRMARKAISSSVVWTGYEFFIGRNSRKERDR